MKKLLGFVGLTFIALLTACTADSLDDIVEAGGDVVPESVVSGDGVPVLLSVGSVAGSTELTRSPLAQAGTNFSTPTGALASDYKYMGLFALAQTNLPAGGQAGPVATANILWDGSVKYARWLWNHPTKATITNQWNGNTVADYTALELMDPSTLDTTPATAPYSYPNNNWYNYYFYTYYPRVADEDISVSENVVTANYELDGSQDIVTGNAKPEVADEDKGFCANYFSDIKRTEGYLPFNKQPQLTLKHHLAQLRFFVCSEDDPNGTFQIKGITLLNVPRDWALTVADKADPSNTGALTSTSTTTTSMPILNMAVDGSNNMTSATDEAVFDGTTYKDLTTTPAIAGYAMVPTTAMINSANTNLNREFNTTYTVRLVVKSGDVEIPLTRTITTPTGGFVSGKVYNVIIKIDQTSITAPIPQVVDLGLSVKWANMNVGATSETDYGLYFAWGATTGHPADEGYDFNWMNAPYYTGDGTTHSWSKYNDHDDAILDLEDDAAHVNWGGLWRMPTIDEMEELINNTSHIWYSNYKSSGIAGMLFTSTVEGYTDKSIFLPASGYIRGTYFSGTGSCAYCWASSHGTQNVFNALIMFALSGATHTANSLRYSGTPVRAVQ